MCEIYGNVRYEKDVVVGKDVVVVVVGNNNTHGIAVHKIVQGRQYENRAERYEKYGE